MGLFKRSLLLCVCGVLFIGFGVSQADELVFKSGGKLTGKLLSLEGGKLVFESDEVGKVTVGLEKVRDFSTDAPVQLNIGDDLSIKSKVARSKPGYFSIQTDSIAAHEYPISELKTINPKPKPLPKWTGSLTAGFSSTHGNTFAESGSISFDMLKRSEKDRTTLGGNYIVSRSEKGDTGEKVTTQENFTLNGQYDYFWSKKVFSFINGSFKKDHISNLDRRIVAGLGFGYQWIETKDLTYSVDLGLAELCEQYTQGDVIDKNDELSAQVGHNLGWQINDKVRFTHNLKFYPSLTSSLSDYYLTTDAELRIALSTAWYSSFKAILDYDSTPAEGIGTTDTKYIMGIGWKF